ncbi:alpha/beta fold hydrolase [Mucilaginibacter auburnensis]|uniref:Pimeloyl-ACP methyl ester carboxylesterase n=1 Tax=Mucilaginibacter auburnensis TaxID=1457233 RepID=A0A2H9VL29_9SPHI|nr:alpha/beta hydrolase [Mucilaginibacter auburnensis]PJJ79047.1 pimeloyl-ACP methyl ester carboxylesterase [Mucilaginibacter auburnensis]
MPRVFLIPGLGADTRIYNNIEISDYEVVPVDWIIPDVTDTLEKYAQKVISEYDIKYNDVVIGNSLGGMIAMEIAKKVPLSKTILISSIRTVHEAPWYFSVFRKAPIYKLLPDKVFTHLGGAIRPVFGNMKEEELWLFKDMILHASPFFMKWAMWAVLHWTNETVPNNVYQIIGDVDRVFPLNRNMEPIIVKGGTHIMIFDKAKEVNKALKNILRKK